MLGLWLLILGQAATPHGKAPNDIVVIGHRAEQELAACLARSCPPAQDVEASLDASVEAFADGRYGDAQRTLRNSIRRNRNHAADMPGPVSSLYATLATVAEHFGDNELWLSSSRNNVSVLREHLGETHEATLVQELTFADSMVGLGMTVSAAALYQKAQQKAAQSGNRRLAAGAAFRRAWLAQLSRHDREAAQMADEAVRLAGDDNKAMLDMLDILRARIAIRHGDDGAVDALAARLQRSATASPKLLFAPPVDDMNMGFLRIGTGSSLDYGIHFADVGYWIRPDGRTTGAEVLRTSGLGQWSRSILRQVGQRRYVPLDLGSNHPGIYRIDRFTIRGKLGFAAGSRIRQRIGNLTVHVIDLTETDEMTAAHHASTQETIATSAN